MEQQLTNAPTSSESSSVERSSALAKYFQEMSSGTLLNAEGEAQLASKLRELEEKLWGDLLAFAPLTRSASEFIAKNLESKKEFSFKSLRSSATRVLSGRSTKAQSSLDKQAQRSAEFLRSEDPDQELFKMFLSEVESLSTGEASALSLVSDKLAALQAVYAETLVTQKKANRVRNRFVESNLGLVISVARRYQFSGMGMSDLIQEGNLGLLKAVSRFDDRRGFRFSTYATWWIRHAIGRAVADKSRTVRLPVHVSEAHQKIRRTRQELTAKLGREPSREELAEANDLSVRKLEKTLQNAQASSLSLDAPLGEDGDRERLEVFTMDTSDSVFDKMSLAALSGRATDAMSDLAPIEIEILNRRFGLAGKSATTLQEIANTIGKSRERIRQIQEKALMKLRERLVAEAAV